MTKSVLCVFTLVLGCSPFVTPGFAQEAAAGSAELYVPGINYDLPAVLVTAADIARTKQEMMAKKATDVPIRMVDCGGGEGGHYVGVSLVLRYPGQVRNGAVHDRVSEVYHILEGSGTMLLGGKLSDPERRPFSAGNGPGITGNGVEGGVRMRVSRGDVLIIPAGTPHRFEAPDELTVYTVTRVDPEKATPLQ